MTYLACSWNLFLENLRSQQRHTLPEVSWKLEKRGQFNHSQSRIQTWDNGCTTPCRSAGCLFYRLLFDERTDYFFANQKYEIFENIFYYNKLKFFSIFPLPHTHVWSFIVCTFIMHSCFDIIVCNVGLIFFLFFISLIFTLTHFFCHYRNSNKIIQNMLLFWCDCYQ